MTIYVSSGNSTVNQLVQQVPVSQSFLTAALILLSIRAWRQHGLWGESPRETIRCEFWFCFCY